MWKSPGTPVLLEESQLAVGLYVWLNMSWDEHPFLTNRFLIKSIKEIETIRSLGAAGRLYYYPEKSTTSPNRKAILETALADIEEEKSAGIISSNKAALAQEILRAERVKKDAYRVQKDAAVRAERAWENAARSTKDALLTMARSPKSAGEQLSLLSRETASTIAKGQEVLLHLLGDKKDSGPQFHALNTMTLCMVLGKRAGLTEAELGELALGALAHDAGKALIPAQIMKTWPRKKHEEDFYRQHVHLSVELATKSGVFSQPALDVIADHHEAVDGTGWPKGRKNISKGARILALVNLYDRLCTPEVPSREALMPSEALATLFRHHATTVDNELLRMLIKLLGIYPRGTVVKLSDDSLALVVAPGPDSLRPRVVIYTPEISKDLAPMLDLSHESDLKIVEALKPSSLPPDALEWLNPQQRLSYFYSVSNGQTN